MTEPETFPYEQPLRDGMIKIVVETLRRADAADHLSEMYENVVAYLIDLLEDRQRQQPSPKPLACRAGCSFCCNWYEVHITPIEAVSIGDYVDKKFDADRRQALLERVRELEDMKKSHPPDEVNSRFPCPMLEDGKCSVYMVRPLVCRGFNSFDAEVCERQIFSDNGPRDSASARIEGYVHPQKISTTTLHGFRLGFKRSGLSSDLLDLTPAVRIALTDADAARRWVAGESVFLPARSRLSEMRGELEDSPEPPAAGETP